MAENSPAGWAQQKKKDFANFDLSALSVAGWFLFLSSIGLVFLMVAVLANFLPQPGQPIDKDTMKMAGIGLFLGSVAWFKLGKFILSRLGVSIYRPEKPVDIQ